MATYHGVTSTEDRAEVEGIDDDFEGFIGLFRPAGSVSNGELLFAGEGWFDYGGVGGLEEGLEKLSEYIKDGEELVVKSVGYEKARYVDASKWVVDSEGNVERTDL